MKATRSIADRFWEKVDKSGPTSPACDSPCWLWLAGKSRQGYGTFGLGTRAQGKTVAHRVSYELAHGPIPHGMHVDHICGRRECVNPAHLRLATPKANSEHRVTMAPDNRSGFRGVAWHKETRKWSAQVMHRRRKYHLGLFSDPEDAARAAAAKRAELYQFEDFPLSTN